MEKDEKPVFYVVLTFWVVIMLLFVGVAREIQKENPDKNCLFEACKVKDVKFND